MSEDWRARARAEIASIKPTWRKRYGWNPTFVDSENTIDLFVRFTRRRPDIEPKAYLLRLRYESDFETAGRREMFVNPEKSEEEGSRWWPPNTPGREPFKMDTPLKICLEGTYGFHSHLHRDRDGRSANLNKLLMEIEKCINPS